MPTTIGFFGIIRFDDILLFTNGEFLIYNGNHNPLLCVQLYLENLSFKNPSELCWNYLKLFSSNWSIHTFFFTKSKGTTSTKSPNQVHDSFKSFLFFPCFSFLSSCLPLMCFVHFSISSIVGIPYATTVRYFIHKKRRYFGYKWEFKTKVIILWVFVFNSHEMLLVNLLKKTFLILIMTKPATLQELRVSTRVYRVLIIYYAS